jgi:hypothetical protein
MLFAPHETMMSEPESNDGLTRRTVLISGAAGAVVTAAFPLGADAAASAIAPELARSLADVTLRVNGRAIPFQSLGHRRTQRPSL